MKRKQFIKQKQVKNKKVNLNKFKTVHFQWFQKVSHWISNFYLKDSSVWRDAEPILLTLDRILYRNGEMAYIKYTKSLRLAFYGYLSGNESSKEGVRCTKDGLPVVLGDLISRIRRSDSLEEILRVVSTILTLSRSLKPVTYPDITTITRPGKYQEPSLLGKYKGKFWKNLRFIPFRKEVPKSLLFTKYHMSSKSGPNGHALWSSLIDLETLPDSLVESISILGGMDLREKITTLREGIKLKLIPKPLVLSGSLPPNRRKRLRKLSYFPDKEGKMRIIGILDYFSQTSLRNLHNYLFNILKRIPQDCTFQQGSFIDKVKDWDYFYSLDLSAATDRFPISFIGDVLQGHLPLEYTRAWHDIMVSHPFEFIDPVSKEILSLRYEVGNPMGAYSSWASFAVAHHYVMFYCCMELDIRWVDAKYVILGDDVLIGDHNLADLYKKVMEELGVEISIPKTHQSPHFCEFAKRLLYKGEEISPFPISALKEESKRYYSLTNLLLETKQKGWVTPDASLASAGYHELVLKWNSRRVKTILPRIYGSERLVLASQCPSKAHEFLDEIPGLWGYTCYYKKVDWEGILSLSFRSAFQKSLESINQGESLGDLATSLVMKLTTPNANPDLESLSLMLIYALPILNVYGQFEELYMRIRKDEKKATSSLLRSGQWPSLLRSLSLPNSDKIFSQRKRDVRIFSSCILGKFLELEIQRIAYSDTDIPVYKGNKLSDEFIDTFPEDLSSYD